MRVILMMLLVFSFCMGTAAVDGWATEKEVEPEQTLEHMRALDTVDRMDNPYTEETPELDVAELEKQAKEMADEKAGE